MRSFLRQLQSKQSGQALVLVSITMAVLLGFGALVTDVGQLYLERQRLTAAADMASLAAVQLLPDRVAAEATAREYLEKNGVDPDAVTIEINGANDQVAVRLHNAIPTTFARVLGYDRLDTWGGATARVSAISAGFGAVPLAVAQDDWVLGQQVVLKRSSQDSGAVGPGNYQALALGGRGANTYEENLANGYEGRIQVGDWLETQPGNMAGPTTRAASQRISADPTATWQTVSKDSPRLIMVPILRDWNVNGRSEVLVVGFGIFFMESVGDDGESEAEITGRFLRVLGTGESNGTAPDFGLRTVKLIR